MAHLAEAPRQPRAFLWPEGREAEAPRGHVGRQLGRLPRLLQKQRKLKEKQGKLKEKRMALAEMKGVPITLPKFLEEVVLPQCRPERRRG